MPEPFLFKDNIQLEKLDLFFYQNLVLNSPMAIFTSTPEGRFLTANPAMARMFGYETPEELVESITDLAEHIYADPEDREEFKSQLELHGEVEDFECLMLRRDGSRFWCSQNALLVRNNAREVLYYQGFMKDITKRKLSEQALIESEQRWRSVLQNTPQIGISLDAQGKIIFANKYFLNLTGWKEEQVLEQSWFDMFIPADIREQIREVFNSLISSKHVSSKHDNRFSTYENAILTRDGDFRIITWSNVLNLDQEGYPTGLTSLGIDTTERKRLEDALSENRDSLYRERNRLQSITETMGEGLYVLDEQGRITFVNKAAGTLLGYSQDELPGQVAHDLFHELHYDKGKIVPLKDCPLFQTVLNGQVYKSEENFKRKDDNVFPVEVTSRPMIDAGKVVGSVTVFRDISKRRKAETTLRASEEKYRSLMEQSRDMIFLHDFEGNFLDVNQAAVSRTGYSKEELLSMNVFDLNPELPREEALRYWQDCSHEESILFEGVNIDKQGRKYPVEVSLGKVCFGNKEYVQATVRDISKRLKTEENLKEIRQHYRYLLQSSTRMKSFHNIIGRNKKMQNLYVLLQQLAEVDSTVLVTGETGTGKELVAEALHVHSKRNKAPLIKVNCLTLAEDLLDSELFGHVRGAFTGAFSNRIGRVEAAEGGTLFLDEIGDITPRIQLKLLRFLQEREYERVGESITRKADVRIVAATNADLKEKVKQGVFRKDLYYRLRVMSVHMPGLLERSEDIPLLIHHFCNHFAKNFNKPVRGVSKEAMTILLDYSWPGNVRELEHALEHGVLVCTQDMIKPEHLPLELLEGQKDQLQRSGKLDREDLADALKSVKGNKTEAARLLGISRRTLYRKLHEHGFFE